MIIEFLIFTLTAILFAFLLHRKPEGLPPGEWGLPIVGYVPFVNWKLSETFKKLHEKHGKIFCIKLGSLTFVVIGDYKLLKEAYGKEEFTGRPYIYGFDVIKKDINLGSVTSSGHKWLINRRFAIKTLKDFGLGKSKLEEVVLTEAEYLIKELKESVDKPYRVEWTINVAVLNVIWRLVADIRYDIKDKEINDFSRTFNECVEDIDGPMALLTIFPWAVPICPNFIKNSWMKVSTVQEKRDRIFKKFEKIVEEHKKNLDKNDPRDFVDKYLIEMEQQKDNPDYKHFGDPDLLVSMFELFAAGSETTSSTLRWFFLYMAKFPNIQKRVQEEIDIILPRDKLPSMQDKDSLPCLNALTYEIGRVVSLLPNALPHSTTEDTTLAGYSIPKGTLIVPNSEIIHKDPRYWKHPNEFSIDNFLDKDGKFIPKVEGFVPFSVGRRQCLGEPVAKLELFIFIGAILQNFSIMEPEGQTISLVPDQAVNVFNYPVNSDIILKIRI